MSHELRTPLNAISGHAELVMLGLHGPITAAQREAIDRIQRNGRHLLGLINDVLNFAKLEAGHVEYAPEDVPVRAAVETVESLLSAQILARALRFRTDEVDDLAVHADPEKLRQILLNLLSNAIKFTPEGGEIAVRATRLDGLVCIAVCDTGVGIPTDRLADVFAPFVQVDRTHASGHEGTGLGLAISRDLARGMGGELSAESEVGKGSTFTLLLPMAAQG